MCGIIRCKVKRVRTRNGKIVGFDSKKIQNAIKKAILATEGIANHEIPFLAQYEHIPESPLNELLKDAEHGSNELTNEVIKKLNQKTNNKDNYTPTIKEIQEFVLEVIHEDTKRGDESHYRKPLDLWSTYMYYMYGRHVANGREISTKGRYTPNQLYFERIMRIAKWNKHNDCGTTSGLKEWFSKDNKEGLAELIRLAEEAYMGQLIDVAKLISEEMNRRDIRVVIISGPSSSGKTTTTRILEKLLMNEIKGFSFKGLEVDMYFRSYREYRKLEYEIDGGEIVDYDYEQPDAYRIGLINEHLRKLMNNKKISVPKYDFTQGTHTDNQTPFSLSNGEILLMDSLHALYPPLTEAVPDENKLKIYVEPMIWLTSTLGDKFDSTDLRMLRRMLRDVKSRGHDIKVTLWHWHLVRKGEAFIFPYIPLVDYTLNGSLAYELPILKAFLYKKLNGLVDLFERNEDIYDGAARLSRVLKFLDNLTSADQEQINLIPPNSVLREFIGNGKLTKE